MMKLSTRGRYGARLMLELALRYKEGPALLKDISKSQDISVKYLGQLIIPLKIAGLIKTTRGSHGGYFLAKAPNKITLLEIVTAVEGIFCIVECINSPEICNRSNKCITRIIWKELNNKIIETLNSYTLEDLIKLQEKKLAKGFN
jgi:Rrf2 family protein